MTLDLRHRFESENADGADPTQIQPSHWNDDHQLVMATDRLVGRTTAGDGEAEEVAVGTGLTLAAQVLANSDRGSVAVTTHEAAENPHTQYLQASDVGTAAYLAVSTDGTLSGDSDALIPSQKAVKTYADQLIAAADVMVFKGVIDCSANPNYPAADAGWTYRVSVAGKIGGASGLQVEAGDLLLCLADSTASGNQATVGASWSVAQTNVDGAVVGPASAVNNRVAFFDGTTGRLIKDSGLTLSGTNTGDQTSVSGNAGTATALQNARTIDGVNFDGTANITVVAPATHAATSKATPVDADEVPLVDSAASNVLKRLTWANLKATLKTYFDSLSTTLTNKTLSAPVITDYTETLYAPAAASSATISLANGTVQKHTTNGNFTATLPSSVAGKSYVIIIAYGGTHTLTWAGGGTLKWAGGAAPTATSANGKFDIFVFTCDGTNTFGRSGGANF